MIDFIKGTVINTPPEKLLNNPLLEFNLIVNSRTGACGKWLTAYFKGLKFSVYDRSDINRIIIEGSLHKYKNKGLHNFDNFNTQDLSSVLLDIYQKFKISPLDIILTQLEIGVNFTPPIETKKILEACFFHKTTPFKWIYTEDEGNYIQVQHKGYFVKIYDKQKHYSRRGYHIPYDIMRFELKYKREKLAMELGKTTAISLQNVLSFGLGSFKRILAREWRNILFYDSSSLREEYKAKYSNPNYWKNLTYEQFKYNRKKLNSYIDNNSSNLRDEIIERIKKKTSQLTAEFPDLNLYI